MLIKQLQAVASGEVPRLMVFMPPGSAKSSYVSDLFPPWMFAQRSGLSIIGASNTSDLAETFSRRVRGRIREHHATLGYGMEREAEELWTTSNRGQYRAAGVGGAIAGFRADLAIIDDPIRSREEADSETRRNRIWEWYQDDLMTRLRPGGAIVLVQTRWHEDDLAGRLLEREGARWKVLSIPAIAEGRDDPLGRAEGEPLWGDDQYGYGAELLTIRETAETRKWTALYQQRPAPDTGDYFRRDWLRTAAPPPRSAMRVFGASDYAVTADGGDYTVHVVVGVDSDDRLYVLDLWRHQTASDQWVEAFCDLVIQWKPMGWAEETGQIRASLGPWLDRRQRERRAFVARQAFPTRGDKSVRAQSIRGRMALSGLFVPSESSWSRADLEAELMSFPAGKHDDQVDALGLVGQLLDVMLPPSKPKPTQVADPTDYRRRPRKAQRDWMTA